MLPVHSGEARELVEDSSLVLSVRRPIALRQCRRQFLPRRHSQPPHRSPRARSRFGSNLREETAQLSATFQVRQCADGYHETPGQARPGSATERESQMMNDTIEPRSPTGMGRENVITEALSKDTLTARPVRATKAPCCQIHTDHAPGKRQIRDATLIMAMNTRRNRTATRALHCRSDCPHLYDRVHTLVRNTLDPKPGRSKSRWPQRYRHRADSRVKPA